MSDLYLTLKNGMKMPRLGMGTWMLGEHLSIYQQEKKALQAGLDAGFTLIDTAEMYGNGLSEKLIGDTTRDILEKNSFLFQRYIRTMQDVRRFMTVLTRHCIILKQIIWICICCIGAEVFRWKKQWMQWKNW